MDTVPPEIVLVIMEFAKSGAGRLARASKRYRAIYDRFLGKHGRRTIRAYRCYIFEGSAFLGLEIRNSKYPDEFLLINDAFGGLLKHGPMAVRKLLVVSVIMEFKDRRISLELRESSANKTIRSYIFSPNENSGLDIIDPSNIFRRDKTAGLNLYIPEYAARAYKNGKPLVYTYEGSLYKGTEKTIYINIEKELNDIIARYITYSKYEDQLLPIFEYIKQRELERWNKGPGPEI